LKKADLVSLGRVLRSQGNQGKVKIRLREEDLPGFSPRKVFIEKGGGLVGYEVQSFERARNSHFLKLAGIDTLAQADELAGADLFITEDEWPPLEDDRLYQFQVIGSRVVGRDGAPVGTVKGIIPVGAGSLLVVDREGRELMIPLTEAICVRVDPERREIEIDPPEGLLELNEI
jgi:16S rRNA processing protein RimM